MTVTIAGSTVAIKETTFSLKDKIDERTTCTFTIEDLTGTAIYSKGQTVSIVDSVLGTLFTGYVNDPIATKLYPSSAQEWQIDCIDQGWMLDKRTSNKLYNNQYAGTIVADMIQRYASAEGVTGGFALDWNELETEWQGGVMNGTTATTNASDGNPGDGDLELSLAGAMVTHTDTTTSDFSAGTPVNINTSNNQLQLTSYSGLSFSGKANSGYGSNLYWYQRIWSGSYTIGSSDYLWQTVWINSSSPQIMAAADFVCSDGTSFRNQHIKDQQGIDSHPGTDLSGFANDQWYTRNTPLSALAGKSMSFATVAFEGDSSGSYQAYFYNIYIGDSTGATVRQSIYNGSANPGSLSQPYINTRNQSYGYSDVVLQAMYVYLQSGTWISSAHSCAGAGTLQSSQLYWSITDATTGISSPGGAIPANTTLSMLTSFDGGVTYQPISAQYSAIPNYPLGATLTGRSIQIQVQMSITGKDPTVTPTITDVTWIINPSYAASKTDILQTFTTSSDFSAGTETDVAWNNTAYQQINGSYAIGLAPNSWQRNWMDGVTTNQTLYGTGSPSSGIYQNQFYVENNNGGNDVRSRFDFAGQWQNFTAQIDVLTPSAQPSGDSIQVGLVYRCTGWQNNNNTYAYAASLEQDQSTTMIVLGKGSNSSSGSGSYTQIASYTFASQLAAGGIHTLKVVVSGSTHQIYLDDFLAINTTDATYTAAGYIGIRQYNNSAGHWQSNYSNFGVIASDGIYTPFTSYSGSEWTSQNISLGSFTVGNSLIQWNDTASTACYFAVFASVNGGAYTACTNGAVIPGLTNGTVLTSAHLQIQVQMQGASAIDVPVLTGLSVYVMPQFNASGTWSTAPLGNDAFIRANQSGWGTSTDGQTYNHVGSATLAISSDAGTITGSTAQQHMQLGSQTGTNESMEVEFAYGNTASQIGAECRYTNVSGTVTAYRAYLSGSTLTLDKRVSGTVTSLGTASFTTAINTKYRIRVVATGTTIEARCWASSSSEPSSWQISVTDSSIASGGVALSAVLASSDTAKITLFYGTLWPDPALSLANIGRAAYSLVNWNANLPANTSLTAATSIDGGASYQTVSVAGNPISNMTLQPSPIADTFSTNDSSSYTQSNFGGTTGTWTWDTANSRLTGSGGNGGTLVNTTALTGADNQIIADFDECDGSGIIANYQNASNMYYVQIWDASGTGTQNAIKLFKRASGTSTQLGSTASISFVRGSYRRFVLDVEAGVLTVSMDGTQLLQQTDGSPLAAGGYGLLLNTVARCYNLRTQQYGEVVTSLNVYTKLTLSTTDPTVTPQVLDQQTFVSNSTLGTGALVTGKKYQMTFLTANLNDLTTASNYWSYVNSQKQVLFQPRNAVPAPWVLASANQTSIQGQLIGDVQLNNLQVQYSADLYRNRQNLINVIGTVTTPEIKIGDGTTTTWNVTYPLTAPPILTLNDQSVTVGVKGVDTGKQYYYQLGSTAIDQDSSQAVLQETDALVIVYTGSFTTNVTRDNTAFANTVTQSMMAAIDGSSGIVEATEDVSSQNMTVTQAQTYGDQLLQEYGAIARTPTVMTLKSGLAPGQQITVNIPEQNVIDAQMLVQEVDTAIMTTSGGSEQYEYTATIVEGAALASWVKLFSSVFNGT